VLGVVVLDAHAALPEHHHVGGTETLCFASLAVATLAVAAWALGSIKRAKRHVLGRPRPRSFPFVLFRPLGAIARAGPAPPVVLRR
jgi:hypothetical protein